MSTTNSCFDCGKNKGTYPVVLTVDRQVKKVCRKCFERYWLMAMHSLTCECPHCERQIELKKESV